MKKTAFKLEMPLLLDFESNEPLYMQIRNGIKDAILCHKLKPGSKLPSTRELAKTLNVSRIVTIAAYEELHAQGYIESRQGSGTHVVHLPSVKTHAEKQNRIRNERIPFKISFEPGYPDAAAIQPATWKKTWRHMSSDPITNRRNEQGDADLRESLCSYIARTRGFTTQSDNIIITSGTFQALDLIALSYNKDPRIGLENPGYKRAQNIFLDRNFDLFPLSVNQQGLIINDLPKKLPLLYVTPSHQYPLGGTMPVANRLKLLKWAKENNAYIIEDDFDSEFRYDIAPVPALKSLDTHDRVIYIGTFSKILNADLHLGYIIPPATLAPALLDLKKRGYDLSPWPVQRALHHMIRLGELEKHIRRMRLIYARRRQILKTTLSNLPNGFELVGEQAGLHSVLLFPSRRRVDKAIKFCAQRNVEVVSLADYHFDSAAQHGLVLGYSHLDETLLQKGSTILKEACHSV